MIEVQDVIQVALVVIAVAVVVRFVVEGLKTAGRIEPAQAGNVQALLNFVVALILFVAGQFGFERAAQDAIEKGLSLAPGLLEVALFVASVLATKGIHLGFKWAGVNAGVPKG